MNYRIKTPSIIQMETSECGAVALAIILRYYKKYTSIEEIRVCCGVSRDGSNAKNIVEAAKEYGLTSAGYNMSISDLKENKIAPAILFWENHHFVVFEGYRKGKFYINDPAQGHGVFSENDFLKYYSGIALVFNLSEKFQPSSNPRNFIKTINYWMDGSYHIILFFIMTGLFLIIPGIVVPAFTRIFIDDILITQVDHWFPPLIFAMILVGLMKALLIGFQDYYLLRFEEKLAIQTSSDIVWKILNLPVQFFSQRSSGEINSRIGINNDISQFLGRTLVKACLDVITIVFFIFIMLFYSVKLTLVVIFILFINIVVVKFFSEKIRNRRMKVLNEKGKLFGLTAQGLLNIESIKSMGDEIGFVDKFSGFHSKVVNEEQNLKIISNYFVSIPGLITALSEVSVLILGSYLIMEGAMTVGMLIAYQVLLSSLTVPINSLVQMGGQAQEMVGNIKRIEDILNQSDQKIIIENGSFDEKNEIKIHSLNLINISFGYGSKNNPIISNFDLDVKAGEMVAIVGKSGSGKSTLLNLITGLYAPWQGEIKYNGKDLNKSFLNEISFAEQTPLLFNGSIRENISMLDENLSEQSIINACKDSLIYETIISKPGEFNSLINENGSNFSGGEKQRLEIARTLSGNPSLIIMDEATNALDPISEKIIMENIRKRGVMLIVVAHRLSAIRDADKIVVLDKGKIVECGSHEELIRINGYYVNELNKSQI